MVPGRMVQVGDGLDCFFTKTRRSSVKAAHKSGPLHTAGLQVCRSADMDGGSLWHFVLKCRKLRCLSGGHKAVDFRDAGTHGQEDDEEVDREDRLTIVRGKPGGQEGGGQGVASTLYECSGAVVPSTPNGKEDAHRLAGQTTKVTR
jgi:hypothetical protein